MRYADSASRDTLLEAASLVVRSETQGKKAVRYTFTETGAELRSVVLAMGTWGARWIMNGPTPDEGDPDLIMMYLARHLNEPNLPKERVVVEFVLPSGRSRRRYWLLLIQGGSSLCLQHPGFDTNLTISSKVADLQRVYMGHFTWAQAVKDERITLQGPQALKRRFPAWMLWSRFAPVVAAKEEASQ
ncbi:MAG: hypothetical protein ACJA2W_000333 [Planctomycetota bacterium]|jgi:hypothetical protein